jgi:hypothetical protein
MEATVNAIQASQQQPRQDAGMLHHWMERILRHFARLLVGRMTLTQLLNIMREIFVQECEMQLQRERPGRNVPLSQLALLTGLDTRTLTRIRSDLALRQMADDGQGQASELSPEARVVEMWAHNARFADARGKPRALSCVGAGSEFEELVRRVVTARGVTVQSILERLLATGSAEVDRKKGVLRLLTPRFSPFNSEDEVSLMNNGLQAINNLSGSVARNLESPREERVIQRELWTFRLDRARRAEFRDKVRGFLLDCEQRAEGVMAPLESEFESENQMTAGLGIYFFEEPR